MDESMSPMPDASMGAGEILLRLTASATLAAGAMLHGAGSATLSTLALGTAGRVLVAGASAPAWSDAGLSYASGVLAIAGSAPGTPSAGQVLIGDGAIKAGGAISCTTLSTSSTATIGDGTSGTRATINGAAGQLRRITYASNGSTRWEVAASATAESGSDAGSDFVISARTDAGASIDSPLTIARASGGAITLTRPLTAAAVSCTTLISAGKITTVSAVPVSFADLAAVQTWLAANFT